MQVQSVQLSKITGTVKGVSDADYPTASIWLVRGTGGGQGGDLLEDWSFAFGSLLPGQYGVMARAGDQGAFTHLTVSGDDVSVTLVPGRLWKARGRIRIESSAGNPLRPEDVRLDLAPVDGAPLPDEVKALLRIGADGSFEQPGILGSYLIRARLPDQWMVKSVQHDGRDVTDIPIDFTSGDVDDITVVVSDRISTVSGRVAAAAGSTALGAPVFVFADDQRLWGPRSRYVKATSVTREGTYSVRALPAGRYIAVCADDVESDQYQDPDVLERLRRRGTSFTLDDGETKTVDLKLADR
jgi:hypothetical protein